MLLEALGRIRDQPPRDLQEEEPDRQLHAADQRLREPTRREVEQSRLPEHDEDPAHEQGAAGDLVRSEPLRDRDRAERLQRLDGHRKPVDGRRGQVQQARGQQHRGGREAVLHDQRHGDRHEHADVGDRTRELVAIQLQNVASLTPVAMMIRIAAARQRR